MYCVQGRVSPSCNQSIPHALPQSWQVWQPHQAWASTGCGQTHRLRLCSHLTDGFLPSMRFQIRPHPQCLFPCQGLQSWLLSSRAYCPVMLPVIGTYRFLHAFHNGHEPTPFHVFPGHRYGIVHHHFLQQSDDVGRKPHNFRLSVHTALPHQRLLPICFCICPVPQGSRNCATRCSEVRCPIE